MGSHGYDGPAGRDPRRTAWTRPPPAPTPYRSPPSSTSSEGTSAFRRSRGRCRPGLASPSRCCRCSSQRSTRSWAAGCSCCSRRTPTRATRRTARAGSSAPRTSRCFPDAASRTTPASCRRPTSWASGTGRSTSSRREGWCAPRLRRSPKEWPPSRRDRRRWSCTIGDEPGVDGLAEHLALAGYERVERVDERGQFAVRGGIVDVFPSTGREPLRVELFGDEIEQVRAFSPFTQRALHAADQVVVYPAAERRADLLAEELDDEPVAPTDLVPPVDGAPDLVWQPDDVRRIWDEEGLRPLPLDGATELDPFPQGQPHRFEAQRPAVAARGIAEAENELQGFVRAGNRVVVTFAHRGEAERQKALLRKVDAPLLGAGEPLPRDHELRFAVAPARRGFVWRELGLVLLPDTQVFRKKPPRADAQARARARELRRASRRRSRRPRGPRHREAARLRHEGGRRRHARLPPPRVPRRGSAVRPARAGREALALHRGRRDRPEPLEARRQGVAEPQGARPRLGAGARGRAAPALRAAATRRRHGVRGRERLAGAARGVVPLPRDRRPAAGDRGGQGRPRVAAADGPPRVRGRRLRQDRGRSPRRLRRRGRREAGARALPDDDPRRAALEHVSRALQGLPDPGRDGVAVPQARRGQGGAPRVRRGEGRRARRHAPDPLA